MALEEQLAQGRKGLGEGMERRRPSVQPEKGRSQPVAPALPVPTLTTGTQCPILWAAWVRAVSRQGEVGRAKLAIMRALWKQDSPPNQGVKAVTGFYT